MVLEIHPTNRQISKAEVIKAKEKDKAGRRGRAPHWFKGTIMQLLVFSQTFLAAHNHSNVALRGTVKEDSPPP